MIVVQHLPCGATHPRGNSGNGDMMHFYNTRPYLEEIELMKQAPLIYERGQMTNRAPSSTLSQSLNHFINTWRLK